MNGDNHTRNRLPRDAAESPSIDRGRQIDRLVSGDLHEPERLELLAWLDAEPGRWRRCGRAFLESQVWREAFAEMEFASVTAAAAAPAQPIEVAPHEPVARRSRWPTWRPAVSAAVVACVFGCGWWSGQLANQRPGPAGNSEVNSGLVAAVAQPKSANAVATRVVLEERPMDCEFTLPMLGAGLPAEHWARQVSVPGYIKSQWGNQGYQVSEKRQFVPMELADGRQVVVPINHVTLTYVGQHLL